MQERKLSINYYQRKPHIGSNFSIEYIFEDLRKRLGDRIQFKIYESSCHNIGFFRKVINILEVIFRRKRDICHITGENHYLNMLMPRKRVVLTIHDCGMLQRKTGLQLFFIRFLYLTIPVQKSTIITTVSDATKKEIIRITSCDEDKIKVIPVAVNSLYMPFPKDFNHECPNILQIGTGYNKNLFNLIAAIKDFNCHLTIVGKLSDSQIACLRDNNINYFNDYNISNEMLLRKYQEADIVSFVSTAEGFGMPIIEANSVERVVITSNVSSMPEVAGNAACLVNPNDIESIKAGFEKVINNADYRKTLIENGRVNKLRFDAKTVANMYMDVYQIVNKKIK